MDRYNLQLPASQKETLDAGFADTMSLDTTDVVRWRGSNLFRILSYSDVLAIVLTPEV